MLTPPAWAELQVPAGSGIPRSAHGPGFPDRARSTAPLDTVFTRLGWLDTHRSWQLPFTAAEHGEAVAGMGLTRHLLTDGMDTSRSVLLCRMALQWPLFPLARTTLLRLVPLVRLLGRIMPLECRPGRVLRLLV